MKIKILILVLAFQILMACSSIPASLYIHKAENYDGDIFGNPKNGFFYDKSHFNEITKHELKFSNEEYKEIEKLIMILKSKQDLDTIELSEAPHDIALIIKKDTLYTWGNSNSNGWIWKKKATYFESTILKKILDKHNSKKNK